MTQLKTSTATVSAVKTGRSHQTPPSVGKKSEYLVCLDTRCCVKGHYHPKARSGLTGASQRKHQSNAKKESRPIPQILCKHDFACDCGVTDEHSHTPTQKVCPVKAVAEDSRVGTVGQRFPVVTNNMYDILSDDDEEESTDGDEWEELREFYAPKVVTPTPPVVPKSPPAKNTTTMNVVVTPAKKDIKVDTINVDVVVSKILTDEVPSEQEEDKVSLDSNDNVKVLNIPTHTRGNVQCPSQYYTVNTLMLKTLKNKFPNPYLCENFLNTALACIKKEYQTEDRLDVIVESISYYVNSVFVTQQSCRSANVVGALNVAALTKDPTARTFIQPSTLDYSDYVRRLGMPVDHGSMFRVYGVDCEVPQDLSYNGNWEVIASKGYEFEKDGEPVGMFKTLGCEHPKLYMTQFTRISGDNDFCLLDANGLNYSLATSRLFKARVDDAQLRTNQLKILNHFAINKSLLSVCSNASVIIPKETKNTKRVFFSEKTPVEQLARQRVGSFFTDVLSRRSHMMIYLYALWSSMVGLGWFVLYLFDALAARLNYVTYNLILKPLGRGNAYYLTPKPSPKRKLYHNWFEQVLHLNGHTYANVIQGKSPEAKFKNEPAKPGKFGRLYVTYGETILQLGWIFEYVKTFFCRAHVIMYEGSFLYLKVRKSLDEDNLFSDVTEEGLHAQVYSDDMNFRYVDRDGGVYRFDADISSCDAGNTSAMFYILGLIMLRMGVAISMISANYARLRETIILTNPSNRGEYLKVRPKTIFQGSGCPETTIVNDVASTSIAIAVRVYIHYYNENKFTSEKTTYVGFFDEAPIEVKEEIICKASLSVGHVITVESRDSPENMQFLKYSPFQTTQGEWVPNRNLGAIFRGLGRVDGDITAIMLGVTQAVFKQLSFEQKMEDFMSSVVAGLVNEPRSLIMDALRKRFKRRTGYSNVITSGYHDTQNRSGKYLELSSFMTRYGGEEVEWLELVAQIEEYHFGFHYTSSLVASIMRVDYSLPMRA